MSTAPGARARPGAVPAVTRLTWDIDASWQNYAACRGENPDWFFAPNHLEKKEDRVAREAKAKAICVRCPVRQACLTFAISTREPHGVWGGMNEVERRHAMTRRAG